MNQFHKVISFCRPFRIVQRFILIIIGLLISNPWSYLGIIPLIIGVVDFCPVCIFSKKCTPKAG